MSEQRSFVGKQFRFAGESIWGGVRFESGEVVQVVDEGYWYFAEEYFYWIERVGDARRIAIATGTQNGELPAEIEIVLE